MGRVFLHAGFTGVAQAAMLIREGSSPLSAVGSSDDVLRHRLAAIAAALEER
jgi:hypothetical protein